MNFHRKRLAEERWTRKRLAEEGEADPAPAGPPATVPPQDAEAMPPAPPQAGEPASTQAPEPDDKSLAIKVSVGEGVSDEFRVAAKTALMAIPPEIRKIVSDAGYVVTIVPSMSQLQSGSQASEIPLDRLSSALLSASKEIAMAETTKDNADGDVPTLNPPGVLRHVFGHAVDELGAQFIKGRSASKFSDLDSFKYAHVSDIGRLAQDKKQKLAFYVEDEDAARSEVFAECFAALHEGGSTYTIEVMSQFFPAVMKQVKDTVSAIKSDTSMVDKDGDGVPDETHQKGEPQRQPAPKAPAPQAAPPPVAAPVAAPEAAEAEPENPFAEAPAPAPKSPPKPKEKKAPEAEEPEGELENPFAEPEKSTKAPEGEEEVENPFAELPKQKRK